MIPHWLEGICTTCRTLTPLRKDGTIARHGHGCNGAGSKPARTRRVTYNHAATGNRARDAKLIEKWTRYGLKHARWDAERTRVSKRAFKRSKRATRHEGV